MPFLRLLLSIISFLAATSLYGQEPPKWLRYPSISPSAKEIAFTYKGDLYTVPTSGGKATQLTFHQAHDFMPVWSRDGQTIAFASDRYGNFDIFVMPAQGGVATRLTYHSNDEYPYSFSADNKAVIFGGTRQDIAEHRQYPTASQPELYEVPVSGGRVDLVWTLPAEYVQVSVDGKKLIYHDKKGGENEWRKWHQSAITRDIWIYDVERDTHRQVTTFKGEDRNPVFAPGEKEIYYLSEANGSFNVFKTNLGNPSQRSALTEFSGFPVRFLSISDDGLMSFSVGILLYLFKI